MMKFVLRRLPSWRTVLKWELQRLKPARFRDIYVVAEATTHKDSAKCFKAGRELVACRLRAWPRLGGSTWVSCYKIVVPDV